MATSRAWTVLEYLRPDGHSPYRRWMEGLDRTIQARLQARVFRFELGNLGDSKAVGEGVQEARCAFGPGYRIYFGLDAGRLVILLLGGAKSSQARDISLARAYWRDYQERAHEPSQ